MIHRFQNSSLKKKIIFIFGLILIVNALITGTVYYVYEDKETVAAFQKNSSDMVVQMEYYLNDRIDNLTQQMTALGNNLSFTEPMNAFLQDSQAEWDPILAGDVARMISEVTMSDEFVDSMYIYTKKAVFDDYLLIRKRNVQFTDTVLYQFMEEHPEVNAAWFPAMQNPMYEDADETIPVVYRKTIGNQEIYLVVQISQKMIQDYFEQAYSTFETVFLVNQNGENVLNYEEDKAAVIEAFQELESTGTDVTCTRLTLEGEDYLAASTKVRANDWQIYALMSSWSLTESLEKIRFFLIAENIAVILAGLVVILWISHKLTSSLEELALTMDAEVKSGYHTEFEYQYQDEVGMLAKSYNHMIEEIRGHIQALEDEKERVKEIQKQKRIAELQALQAQINPHFLYNTLNMITWQAVDIGAEDISVISNALGDYFRISLSRGKEVISIKDEIEHVRSYLEIQKIRYEDKMNYEILAKEDVKKFSVIKLILQPLVENALYHGIKPKEGAGTIWVYIEMNSDMIKFIVEDDGVGIQDARLEELNRQLEMGCVDSNTGYGIYNVNNRLRLYYGEQYGLKLEKRTLEGTRAVVSIPIKGVEEKSNV